MADERIQVTLSSRADLSGFAAYQAAAKDFGRGNKDAFDALSKSVEGLSAAFRNDFTSAVSGAAGVIREFVRGGLWGLLGAAANQAVGFAVGLFKEAKERAAKFADVLMAEVVAGMEGVNAAVKGLAAEIGKANRDVDDFVKAASGKIAARAKYDVARLHVEALQSMTDGMSDAAKAVVLADEALKAGVVRQTAAVETAAAEAEALNGRKAALDAQAEQAEANLAAARKERAKFEDTYSKRLVEHGVLEARAGETVEQLVAGGMEVRRAYKLHEAATRRLRESEEANKDLLERRKAVVRGVADAEKALADVAGERAKLSARIEDAEGRRATAELGLAAANLELSEKKRQAEAALEAENEAAKKRADDEYYRAELAKTEGRIMRVCNANGVEFSKYMALFYEHGRGHDGGGRVRQAPEGAEQGARRAGEGREGRRREDEGAERGGEGARRRERPPRGGGGRAGARGEDPLAGRFRDREGPGGAWRNQRRRVRLPPRQGREPHAVRPVPAGAALRGPGGAGRGFRGPRRRRGAQRPPRAEHRAEHDGRAEGQRTRPRLPPRLERLQEPEAARGQGGEEARRDQADAGADAGGEVGWRC